VRVERFEGGRRLMLASAAIGLVGLLLALAGLVLDPGDAAISWLFAFDFWMGLSLGSLILLGAFHTSHAKWPVVLRRVIEVMGSTVWLLPLLFIPVLLSMKHLFPWVAPPSHLTPHELELLHHKAAYLNVPFFVIRAGSFFVLWAVVAWLLERWSRQQDETGEPSLTARQWKLGAATLPLVALALSFATLDWLMSLEPRWVSTIYALYFFSGGFLAVLAILSLVAVHGQRSSLFRGLLRPAHFHSLGKLILGFTAFWAYMAFSQYMLVWIADLPEEVPWYLKRTTGGWNVLFLFLALGRFLLPFFVLLSKSVKLSALGLTVVASWTLFAHLVDVYWLILPARYEAAPVLHWTQPCALVGMGGLFVAFALWRLRSGYPIPVRDPFLLESLQYNPK
jgi:hypothetical protein